MKNSTNHTKSLLLILGLFFLALAPPARIYACTITNVRAGGQPGDAYIGPTCNNDGTYRTCLYITGQDLPSSMAAYQVSINNVNYPLAFLQVLSPTQVVICVTGIPGDGTPNVNVSVQAGPTCTFTALKLFTEPSCTCDITDVRLGGQPGDNYIGPNCNNDGTYRSCFYITGQFLPSNPASYQVTIDGVSYPLAFLQVLSPTQVVICVTGVPGDGTANVTVSVQAGPNCTFTAPNFFSEPSCTCDITDVRLGGQPGDNYIGPTCNNDGTYRSCFYITGQFLPSNSAAYQIAIDDVTYPVAFTQAISSQQIVVCVSGVPADGTRGVGVFVQLEDDCSYSACPLFDEPYPCPGGSFPPDLLSGPWNIADIGNSGGDVTTEFCIDPTQFTVSASGFSSPASDKQEFVYQDICGDIQVTAWVSDIENPGWAGIEIRENLTPGARKAGLRTQLSNFIRRDIRTLANGSEQSQQLFRPGAGWLRLIRQGNNFQGYTSVDGQTWQFAFFTTVPMASCAKVGLYAESINVNTVTTVDFEAVSLAPPASMTSTPLASGLADTPQPAEVRQPAFRLFPNPAGAEVNLDLTDFTGQEVTIALLTANGQPVHTQVIREVTSPIIQPAWPSLSNGAYVVRLRTEDKILTERLVILDK